MKIESVSDKVEDSSDDDGLQQAKKALIEPLVWHQSSHFNDITNHNNNIGSEEADDGFDNSNNNRMEEVNGEGSFNSRQHGIFFLPFG